ncbi:MAG: glycosyltransferase, partial [Actinomycetota bacterium]
IPYPYATDDHQWKNAKTLEKYGAAKVIPNQNLNGKVLFEQVTKLIFDQKALSSMRENSRNLGKPQASRELANLILSLIKEQ